MTKALTGKLLRAALLSATALTLAACDDAAVRSRKSGRAES